MSRYWLLLLLNVPFIFMGLLGAITSFKLSKISKRRLIAQTIIWLLLFVGLILAEPIYNWLFSNNLTQTEPLSLFDVVQITAIVVVFYIANRTRTKLEATENRLQELHRELSIRLSK